MSDNKYKVGMIVKHKTKPDWGLGEIVADNGKTITIKFRNAGTKDFDITIVPLEIVEYRRAETCDSLSDSEKAEIEADVNYFAKPDNIYSLKDLRDKELTPRRPGVYGWYFDESPPCVPTRGCTSIKTGRWPFRTKRWLLYIGQADKLKDRIMKYHIEGRHYAEGTMSSFRLSLGCLFSDKFGLKLYYPPESFGKKDEKLNKWLAKHTRIAWIETENLDEVELEAIEKYTLPLNHKHNRHPLKYPLSKLRTEFKNIAKSKKPKKKHFRKAYKEFVRECKSLGIEK